MDPKNTATESSYESLMLKEERLTKTCKLPLTKFLYKCILLLQRSALRQVTKRSFDPVMQFFSVAVAQGKSQHFFLHFS